MRQDICLSIGSLNFDEIVTHLKNVALAEIRIDLLNLNHDELATIFKLHKNLIATYRTTSDFETMLTLLTQAIGNGCTFVDIDINTPNIYLDKLIKIAQSKGCKVILSYHNFEETPDTKDLINIADKLFSHGACIAKIACMAQAPSDCARVMGLYENYKNLVAFCMGTTGMVTRISAPLLGAPFTYASEGKWETAPGQLSYTDANTILNILSGK
ncbi:MAG: type I 3-dehydroquinate dehydratase [Bacteroidales bacterium]|nr:type I 3-dehydroquinate dehydratase [Tenuifilaceae bacterium]